MITIKSVVNTIIIIIIILLQTAEAGESLFGISNNSLGMLKLPSTSSGVGRSYEIAHLDTMQLNQRNFSTWTDISYTIFSIKAGYKGAFSDGDQTSYNDNANFEGGLLAFPLIKKKLVFGLGLLPYSFISQRIKDESTITTDIQVTNHYQVKGGLSKAMAGFSYKLHPRLNLGLGYEYTFGKITETLRKELRDYTTSTVEINYDYTYFTNGVVLSAFSRPFDRWSVGMAFRPSLDVRMKRKGNTSSDALNSPVRKDITLPAEMNFGLEYLISQSYITGLDIIYQDWKNGFKRDGETDPNQETLYRVGVGFERKPSERIFVRLGEKMAYRLGGFYGRLNHSRNSNAVTEYGLSLGVSLPIQRFQSGIDLSAVIGKRGAISKNSLEETFISFDITINASEIWFRNIED